MNTQPEALRLADALTQDNKTWDCMKAAAELRRLHAVNVDLLNELQNMVTCFERFEDTHTALVMESARAAIAKATGDKA